MKTIKIYKEIPLKYNEQNGKINFKFENIEREVKYIFEAEGIIDEPIWEECDLKGYFVDGYSDKYIGLTKATRKNIKTNKPDWKFKGQFDLEYKRPSFSKDIKVYPKNAENNEIYKKWQDQRDIYHNELRKLNNITELLKEEK